MIPQVEADTTEPAYDELQPWARRAFERHYQSEHRRTRCSRGDFYAGYRAALIELHAWSQFLERPSEAR